MFKIKFNNAAGRFHREERAQISFLAIAASICFIGLLAMVINSNDMVTDRVHVQDVADITALSSASWSARGLNMVSFINVLNTKLATTAVLINALADTIPVVIAVGRIQEAIFTGCTGVPFVGAFCAVMAAIVKVQVGVLEGLKGTMNTTADRLSRCGGGGSPLLWELMKNLERVATGVRGTFVGIGLLESVAIAKANGANISGIAFNGKFQDPTAQIFLPLKDGEFVDHCPYMEKGGPGYQVQGYECNQGPLALGEDRIMQSVLLPFFNLLAHPIFMGMVMSHTVQVGCTARAGNSNEVEVQLEDHAECKDHDTDAKWALVWSETRETEDGSLLNTTTPLGNFVPWYPTKDSTDDDGKDESDAQADKDRLDGLGDLNLPDAPLGNEDDSRPDPGAALSLIEKEQAESAVDYNCRSPEFPYYGPPGLGTDAGFESDVSGSIIRVFGTNFKVITEFDEFTWYSGDHVRNGPKTVGGYFIRVNKREIEREGESKKYVYVVETVSLVSAGSTKMSPDELGDYLAEKGENVDADGTQSSDSCEGPKPWLLDKGTTEEEKKNYQDQLRFIALVKKDISGDNAPFWSTFFNQPPEEVMAYSQAQVYNHLSEDTFTQDWRVRLERATLLRSLLEKVGMGSLIGGPLDTVNNH